MSAPKSKVHRVGIKWEPRDISVNVRNMTVRVRSVAISLSHVRT